MSSEEKSPFDSLSVLQGATKHLDAIHPMFPKGGPQQFGQGLLPYVNVGAFEAPRGLESERADLAGTLAWLRPSGGERQGPAGGAAAWAAQSGADDSSGNAEGGAQTTTVHLVTHVKCLLCGEPMLAQHEQVKATSKTTIVQMLSVVPVCPTCNERARNEPAYFLRQFEASFSRPRLRLVKGGAEGDGTPAGRLCAVETGDE